MTALFLAVLTAASLWLYRAYGSWSALRFVLVGLTGLNALLYVTWQGINAITGAGLNDAVFYHLQTGLEGGDVSQYYPLIGGSLAGLVVLGLALRWLVRHLRPLLYYRNRWADPVALGLILLSVGFNPMLRDLTRYLGGALLIEQRTEGFAEPGTLTPPPQPKNLILIYLESVERTYFDPGRFPGLMTELPALEAGALHFTNMGQTIGASFTIGGMVAGQCGVPLLLSGAENSMQVSSFLAGATCLGDVLKEAGYRTAYMGGSSIEFAGKGSFYTSHGYDDVTGLEALRSRLPDPAYLGPWGLQDDTLFDLARARIDELAAADGPFAFTMLTLDTHHPVGHADTNRACADLSYEDGSNKMLTSAQCADRLAGAFVRALKDSPLAANTVIAVASDHLAMVNAATSRLSTGPRTNLFFVYDPDQPAPRAIDRSATTLDIGATLLSLLGFDAPKLGFGVNLLGDAPTLDEAEGRPAGQTAELHSDYLKGFQSVYDRLWAFPQVDGGLYVNVEGAQIQINEHAFRTPLLLTLDPAGSVEKVMIEDPGSIRTLATELDALPIGTPLVMVDRCADMAPFVQAQQVTGRAQTCLLGGVLGSPGLMVQDLPKSRFLRGDALLDLFGTDPDAATETAHKDLIRAMRVDEGSLMQEVAFHVPGQQGVGSVLKSTGYNRQPSYIRRQTSDSVTGGEDIQLSRGLTLAGLRPDGGWSVLGQVDTCDPPEKATPDLLLPKITPFARVMAAQGAVYSAFAVIGHDSVICDADPRILGRVVEGLNLPVLADIQPRAPYTAVLPNGGEVREFTGKPETFLSVHLVPSATPLLDAPPVPERVAPPPIATVKAEIAPPTPSSQTVGEASPAIEKVIPAAVSALQTPSQTKPVQPDASCLLADGAATGVVSAALPIGPVPMGADGSVMQFGKGWWNAEPAGRWVGAARADITVILPDADGLTMRLDTRAYRTATARVQLAYGDTLLFDSAAGESAPIRVDVSALPRGVPVTLSLRLPDFALRCPLTEGTAQDRRALGLMLQGVTLSVPPRDGISPPAPARPAAGPARAATADAVICTTPVAVVAQGTEPRLSGPLLAGERLTLGDRTNKLGLGNGWWQAESIGRWIGAETADLTLMLPSGQTDATLTLTGLAFAQPGVDLTVTHEGRVVAGGRFGAGTPFVIPAANLPQGVPLTLALNFAATATLCPAQLQGPDTRRLIAYVESITLGSAAGAEGALPPVAHGAGTFNGASVTDSLDALNANLGRYDLFEIDLNWTSDGALVCIHDWQDSFTARFGNDLSPPLTLAAFRARLDNDPSGLPRNCDLERLADWMRAHPTKRIVTDIKEDNLPALEQIARLHPDLIAGFIPQAYTPAEVVEIRKLGFQDVILTLYRYGGTDDEVLAETATLPLFAVTMSEDRALSGDLPRRLRDANGLSSYAHTLNDPDRVACLLGRGIAGIYTDRLTAADLARITPKPDCPTRVSEAALDPKEQSQP